MISKRLRSSSNAINAPESTQSVPQNTEAEALILTLTPDTITCISGALRPERGKPPADRANLATTCRFFRKHVQPLLNQACPIGTLVQHVVYGQEEAAKAMLEAFPGLLFHSATVTDYSGRRIKATAYRAALGAMDVDMVKMITPYFAKLKSTDGEQERIAQYNKQFPEGLPEVAPYDFCELVKTITASDDDEIEAQLELEDSKSEICRAINIFRADLEPSDVIESGLHFNYQTLIKAFEVYDAQFGDWSWPKQDLFWRQAIGYIQRFMPACDAQAFTQGVYLIVDYAAPLNRSLKFSYSEDSMFPLLPGADLGFRWAVRSGSSGRQCRRGWSWGNTACVARGVRTKNYMAQKSNILQSSALSPNKTTWCHIC